MSSNNEGKILVVKNLPFNIKGEELYDIFTRFGEVIQIRKDKKGTAIIVYEKREYSKNAYKELNGFNVSGKYIYCYYYVPNLNKK